MQRATWTDERLDDLARNIDDRFKGVEHRFDHIDQRFKEVGHRFDEVGRRFDEVDRRFEQVDRRFERVEDSIVTLRTELRRDMGVLQVDLKGDIADLRATFNRAAVAVIVCLLGVLATIAVTG